MHEADPHPDELLPVLEVDGLLGMLYPVFPEQVPEQVPLHPIGFPLKVWLLLDEPLHELEQPLLHDNEASSVDSAITGLPSKATAPIIGKAFLAASLKNSLLF